MLQRKLLRLKYIFCFFLQTKTFLRVSMKVKTVLPEQTQEPLRAAMSDCEVVLAGEIRQISD